MRITSAPICAIVMPPSGAATKAEISTIRRSWSSRFMPHPGPARMPRQPALPSAPLDSGAGDERAQRARLVFDLVEPALHNIADADDPAKPPVSYNREVPNPAVRHLGHQLIHRVGGIAGDDISRH